jgi:hypothetical protein
MAVVKRAAMAPFVTSGRLATDEARAAILFEVTPTRLKEF